MSRREFRVGDTGLTISGMPYRVVDDKLLGPKSLLVVVESNNHAAQYFLSFFPDGTGAGCGFDLLPAAADTYTVILSDRIDSWVKCGERIIPSLSTTTHTFLGLKDANAYMIRMKKVYKTVEVKTTKTDKSLISKALA